jgi:hypothetical protein
MLAEFSIIPLDAEHMSKDVAKVIETLENTGLQYHPPASEYGGRGELGSGDGGYSPLSPSNGSESRPRHYNDQNR